MFLSNMGSAEHAITTPLKLLFSRIQLGHPFVGYIFSMFSPQDLLSLYEKYKKYPIIVIDSSEVTENSIFFGLQGRPALSDGSAFAGEAVKKGAAYAVISQNWNQMYNLNDKRFIVVPDTLLALQALAVHHRKQLDIPIIAVTGSNGKTGTTALIHKVLETKYRTGGTKDNFNSQIGVPFSILSIKPTDEIAVIEMGSRHLGDIEEVCNIAMPTHGLITNIGPAHIGIFGSLDNIIAGKMELYEYLKKTNGTFFLNSSEASLNCVKKTANTCILYPSKRSRCKLFIVDPFLVYKANNGKIVRTKLIGQHQLSNVETAVYIGKYFKVNGNLIHKSISNFEPIENRSELIKSGSNVILLDAYNANPVSMKCALEAFNNIKNPNKIVILGGMVELGDEETKFHEEIVKLTEKYAYVDVILCGTAMCDVKYCNAKAKYFADKVGVEQYLSRNIFKHTAFLIKGSRLYELETLLPMIRNS